MEPGLWIWGWLGQFKSSSAGGGKTQPCNWPLTASAPWLLLCDQSLGRRPNRTRSPTESQPSVWKASSEAPVLQV